MVPCSMRCINKAWAESWPMVARCKPLWSVWRVSLVAPSQLQSNSTQSFVNWSLGRPGPAATTAKARSVIAAAHETQRQQEDQDEVVQISLSFPSRFQPDQNGAVSLIVAQPKGAAFPPQVPYNVSDHADKDDFVGSMNPWCIMVIKYLCWLLEETSTIFSYAFRKQAVLFLNVLLGCVLYHWLITSLHEYAGWFVLMGDLSMSFWKSLTGINFYCNALSD